MEYWPIYCLSIAMNQPASIPVKAIFEIHDLKTFVSGIFAEKEFSVHYGSFLIVWVLEGKGHYFVDLKEYALGNDIAICVYPGQIYSFNSCESLKGYALLFNTMFLCPLKQDSNVLLNSGLFNRNQMTPIKISVETKTDMEQLMQSLTKEYMVVSEMKAEILRTLLKLFLMHLLRNAQAIRLEEFRDYGDSKLAEQFLEMVQTGFMTMKKVSDYAETLCISPNYLNIKIKKATGFTASYHIQQRIVLEAKRQVRWEHMSLKETAYKLGYDDLSHFSKFFKKFAGICYTNFKKSGPISV